MTARGRYAWFPEEEYRRRQERASALMDEHGLDAVFLLQAEHLTYFTGYVDWLAGKDPPHACVLRPDRPPVLLLPTFQHGDAEAFTFVEEIRGWRGDYLDTWTATLNDLGLANKRIGAELGAATHLAMPYADFSTLQARLPHATWLDGMAVLWECRKIKSPGEIAYLRRSAAACDAAVIKAWAALQAGMTERELATIISATFMEEGADQVGSLVVRTGRDNERLFLKYATERVFEPGDVISCDIGCVYRGYWSDMQRTACIGAPSPRVAEQYAAALVVNRTVREAIRPGRSIHELDQVRAQTLAAHRLQPWAPAVGHCVGITIVEPPRIASGIHEPLLPGMVFALEPGIADGPMVYNCEDLILVTEEGAESLTNAPRELHVAG